MRYQVIISEQAKQNLLLHVRFLAQINKPAAQKLRKRLIEEIRSLEQLPHRYPFLNAEFVPPNKYHKLYVDNNYLVLYQIRDNIVYVDWIVDCRQDYHWLL